MSDLEMGMVNIITVFHKYSGHRGKLKKADLRALINNEMGSFIKVRLGDLNVNGSMLAKSNSKHYDKQQFIWYNIALYLKVRWEKKLRFVSTFGYVVL